MLEGPSEPTTVCCDSTHTGYDEGNRLIHVQQGPDVWNYEYDAFGFRIATTFNGERTEYLIDPFGLGTVAAEYDAAGNLITRYVTTGIGPVSRIDANGVAAYYDFDAPGSTVALTGVDGTLLNQYSYLPFGEVLTASESVDNPFQFVGGWGVTAEDHGLNFMRNRYYQADVGAFTSLDPLRFPPLEPYGYAFNNPLQFIDPLGLNAVAVGYNTGIGLVNDLASANNGEDVAVALVTGGLGLAVDIAVDSLTSVGGRAAGIAVGPLAGVAFGSNPDTYNGVCGLVNQGATGTINFNAARQLSQVDGFGPPSGGGCTNPPPSGGPAGNGNGGGTSTSIVSSWDPNDIIGPSGYGDDGFLKPDEILPYLIRFENFDSATAPAQHVVVTQQLDADLDFTTFELGSFGFGDVIVTVPTGRDFFSTRLDLLATHGVFVDVTAGIDVLTGLATWTCHGARSCYV